MPASKKITRDAIIDGAFAVLRAGGFSAVNARSIAKELGCSTQPIYLSFRNMDELKAALATRAVEAHVSRVRSSLSRNDGTHSRYADYGIGFIRFAEQEKQLFRWLYLEDGQRGQRQVDILLPDIIRTICEEYGYTQETARMLHQDMICYAYGLAVLANTGTATLSDAQLISALRREFQALTFIYGTPPRMPC